MYSPKFMISWFWSQHLFWTTLNVEVWFLYKENCFHICIYVLSSEKTILCIVCRFHTCKMNCTFVTLILYIKSTMALVSLGICSFFVSDHITIVHLLLKIFPNLSIIILLLSVSFWTNLSVIIILLSVSFWKFAPCLSVIILLLSLSFWKFYLKKYHSNFFPIFIS